jgi:hypothetical protein
MAKAWPRHGQGMAKAWPRHGQGMGKEGTAVGRAGNNAGAHSLEVESLMSFAHTSGDAVVVTSAVSDVEEVSSTVVAAALVVYDESCADTHTALRATISATLADGQNPILCIMSKWMARKAR